VTKPALVISKNWPNAFSKSNTYRSRRCDSPWTGALILLVMPKLSLPMSLLPGVISPLTTLAIRSHRSNFSATESQVLALGETSLLDCGRETLEVWQSLLISPCLAPLHTRRTRTVSKCQRVSNLSGLDLNLLHPKNDHDLMTNMRSLNLST